MSMLDTTYWKQYGYESEPQYRLELEERQAKAWRQWQIGLTIAAVVIVTLVVLGFMWIPGWVENANAIEACHTTTQHRYLVAHYELTEAHNLALIECGG